MRKIAIALLLACVAAAVSAQDRFSFEEGKFKIVQFTDLHWTPQSPGCAKTEATIRSILASEQPALAVLSGDVVTDDPAINGWNAVISIFNETRVPFVVTMGNHDAEYMTKDAIYDLLLASPYYVGAKGPDDIGGCGNCVIPICGSDQKDKAAALIYLIDSNDYQGEKLYGSYDWIHFDQIAWYREQSARFTQENDGDPLPALAFFHIPLQEFNEIVGDGKTYGHQGEGIASSTINPGMFASFIEMKDVMGAFVGHDHDNDYLGIDKGIALGFGRVTGTDAYGDLTRGARVFELHEGLFKFNTWVVTPQGREAVYYYPSGLNSQEEETSGYLPAVKVKSPKQGVAYTYYEGKCKHVADIASCAKIKEGTMDNFSIEDAAADDHFAYEFHALIKIPERGVYRFYTHSDDGTVLYIDGETVVDNDGGHSARRAEGKVALEKGFHELRLLYFEDYMGQELEVGFCGKDIFETTLPDSMLFRPE